MDGNNLTEWLFDIKVLDANPLYDGQTYRLKIHFTETYPIGASPSKSSLAPSDYSF